jgi:hypothetical protein
MSGSADPQTNDDTFTMSGNVTSVAVETIGIPSIIVWLKDSGGGIYQFNGALDSEAVSRLAMLQLLRDALTGNRDVAIRYTVGGSGLLWLCQVRMY